MALIQTITTVHACVFSGLERLLNGWFLGLAARFVFAGVLLLYFLGSFFTKVGTGVAGFFSVQDGAYFQILPTVMERFEYSTANIPFIPYDLIVFSGTYAEFLLPILIVVGLFTRLAALGMIVFVLVQTYVDIAFHGADEKTTGALFDRFSDAVISDQRTLWVFVLLYLTIKGAGAISLDGLLSRRARSAA
ncbi:hypothetical protein MNBD_ALPHA09-1365 [hydrothermal vent metagenome]|uniref:DoxX family protein n=1 Tax=hydrothermal vent metagenome TaxID=652676 RepID=A0A3B0TDA4_9ZZZZ